MAEVCEGGIHFKTRIDTKKKVASKHPRGKQQQKNCYKCYISLGQTFTITWLHLSISNLLGRNKNWSRICMSIIVIIIIHSHIVFLNENYRVIKKYLGLSLSLKWCYKLKSVGLWTISYPYRLPLIIPQASTPTPPYLISSVNLKIRDKNSYEFRLDSCFFFFWKMTKRCPPTKWSVQRGPIAPSALISFVTINIQSCDHRELLTSVVWHAISMTQWVEQHHITSLKTL